MAKNYVSHNNTKTQQLFLRKIQAEGKKKTARKRIYMRGRILLSRLNRQDHQCFPKPVLS